MNGSLLGQGRTVAVLGSGPGGLIAAHAADSLGYSVRIYNLGKKSHLNGAQYLHAPIPRTAGSRAMRRVSYQLQGTPDDYRRKVYGEWGGEVSPEGLTQDHSAWDIRTVYNELWNRYEPVMYTREIEPRWLAEMVEMYDLVISSIPAKALCVEPSHAFTAEEIWAAGDAPGLGIWVPYQQHEGYVTCNGEDSPSWYRLARVFGHTSVEWPGGMRKPPIANVARVSKPLATTCDCWPEVLRVGRYGRWTKGILAHEGYATTLAALTPQLSSQPEPPPKSSDRGSVVARFLNRR